MFHFILAMKAVKLSPMHVHDAAGEPEPTTRSMKAEGSFMKKTRWVRQHY
jgi:hypothetical protein